MIARYFIERPIFAGVCAVFVVIAGLVAMRELPRAQWPNIQPRQIYIETSYPGANALTVADTVAAPIEQAIGSAEGLLYATSTTSGNGSSFTVATFDIDADLDAALIDLNSRVQATLPLLPDEVRRQGVRVRKYSSSNLLVAALTSPDGRYDLAFLNNYARLNIVDEIYRLPGVTGVGIVPRRYYAMRIWLQPDKLARLGLTPLDVLQAVREQNAQYAAGRIGDEPLNAAVDFTFTVNLPNRLSTPEEFGEVVVRTSASTGAVVRLKDVARVELGSNRYDLATKLDGQSALPFSVTVQTTANAIETARLVRARLDELSKSFPPGLAYSIPYDSTIHVREAIGEVTFTLFEALLLVFAVVFAFMGTWRATIIPMLAVPVSIVGAFAVMYMMSFTINTITLFGMVFAIGIVVDDAIIVIENVQRIMRSKGVNAHVATEQAMREVTRPVIAIVFVLVVVFAPVAFMSGLTGTLYRQFAITIAGSVVISGAVALTLTPALCALLLRDADAVQASPIERFQNVFARFTERYVRAVGYLADRRFLTVTMFVLVIGAIVLLARVTPTSLMPSEDRSIMYAATVLPEAASLSRSQAALDTLTEELMRHPAVEHVIAFAGLDSMTGAYQPSGGSLWIPLKPWDERSGKGMSPSDVVAFVESVGNEKVRDAKVIGFEPAPITGGSSTGGFEGFIQARAANADAQSLARVTQAFVDAMASREEAKGVGSTYRANVPQIRIDVDRDKAKTLGVSLADLFTTLNSTVGDYYVNDFSYAGRVWEVKMQADAQFRSSAADLRNVYVRAENGVLVPLTALIRTQEVFGPEIVERFNGFPAARVYGRVAAGYSSDAAHQAMEDVARQVLPAGYVLSWSGTSYQQRVIGQSTNLAFALSVVMVFLILAAQYERWSLPLAVILGIPFAVLGAFIAIWLSGLNNDIFFQIGLVTLVGLTAKNGILIVEYAAKLHAEGRTVHEAALDAVRLRLRPIVMTSAAFVFGVLPLLFATGAGANSRHSIATGVVGGMVAATFVATLFVPLFYIWIAGWRGRGAESSAKDA